MFSRCLHYVYVWPYSLPLNCPWEVFFFFFLIFFFFLVLTAAASGNPAVGFSTAAFTDAATTATAPPVSAAPGPANHSARAACPSSSASYSRYSAGNRIISLCPDALGQVGVAWKGVGVVDGSLWPRPPSSLLGKFVYQQHNMHVQLRKKTT